MKNKNTKRTLSILLALVMVLSALPLTAVTSFADTVYTSGNWEYYLYKVSGEWKAYIQKYNGSTSSLTIPTQIDNYPVIGIYDISCDSISTLSIPKSITYISSSAEFDCPNLRIISVDSNNTNFSSKDGILFNKNKTEIIWYPASKTGNTYSIPDSVNVISCVFCDNKYLETINIPSSVSNIPHPIGYNAKALKRINVDTANNSFTSENGVLFNKNKTTILRYPSAKDGAEYTVPDTVTSIRSSAFSRCSQLRKIILPDSITSLGDQPFAFCTSLESITIPNGIVELPISCFAGCTSLSSIIIPSSVKNILNYCFLTCSSLRDVYYLGNSTQWNKVSIGAYCNEYLTNSIIHYCHYVTYDYTTNGGFSSSTEKELCDIGKKVKLSPIAKKENYNFLGWNTNSYATSGLSEYTMPDNDITLFAIFDSEPIKTYTVSYDANGGINVPTSQTKQENESIMLSTSKPSKSYKITFNANGGSVSTSSRTVNCSFRNWNTESNGTGTAYNSGANYTINEDVILFAQWNDPYIGDLPVPTRNGYRFLGWYTQLAGGTKLEETSVVSGNATIYAHWKEIVTITTSDQFAFANSNSEFTHYNYYVSDKDFKKLSECVKTIYNGNPSAAQTTINELQYQRNEEWAGSCYGMAVATLLDKYNQIGFNENFSNNAKTMHDVQSPRNNYAVESAINYYFLSQFIYPVRDANSKYYHSENSNWKAGLKQLVTMIKSDSPLLFCYWAIGSDGAYGHAIVAKGYQVLSDGSVNITAYDNRYPDNDIIIKINSSYTTCTVNGNENAFAIEYTQDMSAYDLIDIDGSNNIYKASSFASSLKSGAESARLTISPIGKVTVENAEGEVLIVENGAFSGDMEAELSTFNVGSTSDGESNLTLDFVVPDSNYFIFESDTDELNVSVLSEDVYGHSKTDGANFVVISKNDGISVLGSKYAYDISLSINNNMCDMLAINGNATNDVKLEKKAASIKATGVDDKSGEVTVFSNIVDVDKYIYEKGYDSFEVVSDGSGEAGSVSIMGSSKDNGVYDVNIGSSADDYQGFPDVPSDAWFYGAVKYCAQRAFMGGYATGTFGAVDPLQRQDFVVILANIANADLSGYTTCKLKDVDMKAYYGKAVAWAVDKGIIAGYQNGKFGVCDPINREQVATILYRFMGSPEVSDVDGTLAKFPDKGNISAFAKTPIAWAVQNGVIGGMGDGTVAPKGTAVRAQIATMIMSMDKAGMFNPV